MVLLLFHPASKPPHNNIFLNYINLSSQNSMLSSYTLPPRAVMYSSHPVVPSNTFGSGDGTQQGQQVSQATAARLPTSTRPPPPWSRRARLAGGSTGSAQPIVAQPPVAVSSQGRDIVLGYKCYEGKRAHWFIFVPSVTVPSVGKIIQVTGNPIAGFAFQFKDNYNSAPRERVAGTMVGYMKLGTVQNSLVVDPYEPNPSNGPTVRSAPVDTLEQIAIMQGLPYRNFNVQPPPPNDPAWNFPLPNFERCQDWTRNYVQNLVNRQILPPSALQVIQSAPSFGLPQQH